MSRDLLASFVRTHTHTNSCKSTRNVQKQFLRFPVAEVGGKNSGQVFFFWPKFRYSLCSTEKGTKNADNIRIPVHIWNRTKAYPRALEPRLSPAQPGRDRWGEQHKAPCPADSSPSFPNSLSLFFFFFCFPCCPSHYAGRTGRLAPPLPRLDVAPFFASLLSHTTACFFLTSAKVCCFFSLLCLSLFLALSVTSGMTDPWQGKELTNSWSVADWGVCALPSLQILYFLPLKFNRSLPPLSFFASLWLCLWFSHSTELWIFIRLPQRGNIYVLLHFFLSFQALKKKKRKEKGVGVGRSMSPPCGSMLNQNKCDVSKQLTLREMFPILFKELFHGWIQFVLSFLLQLKTVLLRTCFSCLHSWGCW